MHVAKIRKVKRKTKLLCLFLHKCLNTISDVLLYVVEEETVVMQMVTLGTEHLSAVGRDGIELGIGGSDDDGAADGINASISNAWSNELTVNSE